MLRLSLRFLIISATILLLSCREDALEPNAPAGLTTAVVAASNSWTSKARMPTARYRHAAAVATDAMGRPILYVFGGTNDDQSPDAFRTVEAYDPASNTWTTQPVTSSSCPSVQGANGIGKIGNKLYLPGGNVYTGDGHVNIRSLCVYDPVRNTWSRGADMPRNSSGGVAGVIEGRLYVLTASETIDEECPDCVLPNTRRTRRLFRYNPVPDKWVTLPWCPNFHVAGMSGVINGKLYVVGGSTNKLDIYDPATNLWSSGAPLPTPRSGAGAAVVGGKLYVIGGFSDAAGVTDEVLAYNPVTDRWTTKAHLPLARNFLAAAKILIGDQAHIVAVGGTLPSPLSGSDETDVYTP